MPRRICFLVAVLLLNACDTAAQTPLSGPSLGLFFDPKVQAIRPIWGIPGSAIAGQPIDVGFPLIGAMISPLQDYALVVARDGSLSAVGFPPNGPSAQLIPGLAAPERIIFSPDGQSAALYYIASASAQILTNLPGSPNIGSQVDLSTLPNTPNVIAISDDASLLLAGVRENVDGSPAQGEVFLFSSDTKAWRSIASVQHASAIAFVAQTHDALLADDVANSVALMSDVANGANVAWTFSSQQFAAPDSVQASQDRHSFLAGSSLNSMVAILDASGSNAVVVSCGCTPAEFRPLNAASTYQITEPTNGFLWAFDGSMAAPRVFFVPVPDLGQLSSAASSNEGIRP